MKRSDRKGKRAAAWLLTAAMLLMAAASAGAAAVPAGAQPTGSVYRDMLEQTSAENGWGLAPTAGEGTILQAWNWSFANIEARMEQLARQGFTTIQVSPPNEINAATKGKHVIEPNAWNGWWMYYQPVGFQLNNSSDNALGTKEQFISMCAKAHEYGMRIIVDTVVNHMGTCGNEEGVTSTDPMLHLTARARTYEPAIVEAQAFHTPWAVTGYKDDPAKYSQYESTYDLTRNCNSRLPDLDTSSAVVQNAVYEYLDELVAAGADGFRFDAAKHIETPDDIEPLNSDFWTNTLGAIREKYSDRDIYAYGEILGSCGVGRSFSSYTKIFDVTDTYSVAGITAAVRGVGGNATPRWSGELRASNAVLWDESHDTYIDGSSTALSVTQRGKIWALSAGRAEASSLFLARPSDALTTAPCQNILMGEARETSWSGPVIAAVNRFHNYYLGQPESCTPSCGGCAVIERGGTGAVIVRLGDATSGAVSLSCRTLADGSYTDTVSGNTFVVKDGGIYGELGESGVACIYYDSAVVPEGGYPAAAAEDAAEDFPIREGYRTVIFYNNGGWSSPIRLYYWSSAGGASPVQWPGAAMERCADSPLGVKRYIGYLPEAYDCVIVSGKRGGRAVQTVDVSCTDHLSLWIEGETSADHYAVGKWKLTLPVEEPPSVMIGDADTDGKVTILDATVIQRELASLPSEAFDGEAADADGDGRVTILDATAIQRWLAGFTDHPEIGQMRPVDHSG